MNARLLALAEESGIVKVLNQHAWEFGSGKFDLDDYPELEKFAELVIAEFFISEALSQSKPPPMECIGQYTVPCEMKHDAGF